jgi:hypothetical protein
MLRRSAVYPLADPARAGVSALGLPSLDPLVGRRRGARGLVRAASPAPRLVHPDHGLRVAGRLLVPLATAVDLQRRGAFDESGRTRPVAEWNR